MKVWELIELLEQYDRNEEVCAGIKSPEMLEHYDLEVWESNPVGDRQAEERLLIVLGCKQSGRPLTLQEKMREAANKIKLDM